LVILLALPQSATAGQPLFVGDGTPASCTEAALQEAIAAATMRGGGTIKFKCGGDPILITLTATLTLPNNTTIDGDRVIALAGAVDGYLIFADQNKTVVLKSLTIANTHINEADGLADGLGLLNQGTLTITDSTFSNNGDGGVFNEGTLTITKSTFTDNGEWHILGGGIYNEGELTIHHSAFSTNIALSGGGLYNAGAATIDDSTFSENFSDIGGGGGIFNRGTLTVKNSTFADNLNSCVGGGIQNTGTLTVNQSTFSGNGAFNGGGAIGSGFGADMSTTINNTLFSGNFCSSTSGNGGALGQGGFFVVMHSVFSDNTCGYGGAIHGGGTITNSSFFRNSAIQGGAIRVLGSLTIRDSNITQNTASEAGGGIYICCNNPPTLKNTPVTGNMPDDIAP